MVQLPGFRDDIGFRICVVYSVDMDLGRRYIHSERFSIRKKGLLQEHRTHRDPSIALSLHS